MHSRTQLHDHWMLSFTHPVTGAHHTFPATVPGNIEIDLQREGLIGDPYPADNVMAMRDWDRVDDWVYATEFDAPQHQAGETVQLVFEGIDTIADVSLNGKDVLRCENMHIPHTVDVTDRLKPQANSLEVRIHSPELHARRFSYAAGQVSRPVRQAEAYLRKARHMWGWDNAPRLLSAGLWRPVRLEVLPPIHFRDVYLHTQQVRKDTVCIGCNWQIETPDLDLSAYHGVLRLCRDGKVEHAVDFEVDFTAGRIRWELPAGSVDLWWPRGYGDPVLYDASLSLFRGEETVAEWNCRFGIRDLKLRMTDTTNAAGDGELVFVCNGEKIYINGTNWKPLDAMHSRAEARVRRALDLCLDLNCNMVRIWGGGVYEGHDFFDICDEHGLLVWQDFMFACEFPPRDQFYQDMVAREAEITIKRLRNHVSLAVWCGDNEVDSMFFWGVSIPKHFLPSDNVITRKVLQNAVLDHDPYRSYVPSSPYVSDAVARERWLPEDRRSDITSPEHHLYPRDEQFRDAFRNSAAHFLGETGPFFINAMSQSPDIIERELPRARRLWDVPIEGGYTLDRHQTDDHFLTWKDATRQRLLHLFGREFELEPWDDLALGANILCGEIFKFTIEYFRVNKWRRTGVLWWSLLDMWPMMFNYSVVDYNFRPKQPTYNWIRRSQQPLCLMVVENIEGKPELFAANDMLAAHSGSYRIVSVDEHGKEEERSEGRFHAAPNVSQSLGAMSPGVGHELWILEWTTGGRTAFNHYVFAKPPISFEVYREWSDRVEAAAARGSCRLPGNRESN